MKFLRYLLFPFSIVYWLVTFLRNWMFKVGIMKPSKYAIPIINVGNLSTGGTGKTPHVEYLIALLKKQFKVATLSRGYGRKSIGYQDASVKATALHIGDEPMQYVTKHGNDIQVSVDEDRVRGMLYLLGDHPETEVVLLDDAYQHRAIQPGFNILLTTFNQPFFKDFILPTGNLRESRKGKNRADCIIVTKCPDGINEETKAYYKKRIACQVPVFFSSIAYGAIRPLAGQKNDIESVILVTGIAKPEPLVSHLEKSYKIIKHFNFKDHHNFSMKDIDQIHQIFGNLAGSKTVILTTEKDAMRLKEVLTDDQLENFPWFYQEMAVKIDREKELNDLVLNYVEETRRDNIIHQEQG